MKSPIEVICIKCKGRGMIPVFPFRAKLCPNCNGYCYVKQKYEKRYQHLNTFYAGPLRYGIYVSREKRVIMTCGEWY